VIALLKEGKTFREIQKVAHFCTDFIVKVKKDVFGDNYVFKNPRTKSSKNTQAISLFGDGKKSMEVALELDMDSTEVEKAYLDYLRLCKLDRFAALLVIENREKLDLILLIANILHRKGISEKDEILHVLKQIKNIETLHQQINTATGVKSNLVYETTQLQDQENNLKKNIKSSIRRNQFLYQNQRRMKTDLYEKEKRLEQLNKLIQDIYNIEAYQKLEETLTDSIENVILEEHQYIPLIMMAIFESLKVDPQKLESLNIYCNRFQGEKLNQDNIEIRLDYLKSDEFWNDTSLFFEQLSKVYSTAIFAFELKERYKLYKASKNNGI
jgi:hypothetical protein